jgi:AcrR family transcriptional regulator
MVYITHSGENIEKINQILKISQKRFGLYGLEKTTMKEIAADLGISKASLYYYFPDKESLFKAVVEMELEEFFQVVDEDRRSAEDPIALLRKYNHVRLRYFKTLFNLSRLRLEEFNYMKPLLMDTLLNFRDKEIALIHQVITSGIEKGIFFSEDPLEMATLYIEVLKGIRMQIVHHKELLCIEPSEHETLEKKLNMFTEIFIRGLACKPIITQS